MSVSVSVSRSLSVSVNVSRSLHVSMIVSLRLRVSVSMKVPGTGRDLELSRFAAQREINLL